MGQGALSTPVVQWWLILNASSGLELLVSASRRKPPSPPHPLGGKLPEPPGRLLAQGGEKGAVVGSGKEEEPRDLLEFRLSHHCTTGLDRAPCPIA